jgi:Dullard-like phosphatase family protein
MSNLYEIVIFTAGTEEYADKILDKLDPEKKYIAHRLYRQHISLDEDTHYKDLEKIGRDLKHTIIVDNTPHNYRFNKDNGLFIKTWKDDPSDIQLLGLAELLRQIVVKNIADVRPVIKMINEQLDKDTIKVLPNPYENIELS